MDKIIITTDGQDWETWDLFACLFLIFTFLGLGACILKILRII